MLEVKRVVTPSPEQWDIVTHGMRNAFKSWDKNDSEICEGKSVDEDSIRYCLVCQKECKPLTQCFVLGTADKNLLKKLTQLGASDRKVLRQLPVIMDIKAPEYWWRQLDTYKVGTTANSTSQMHTLINKPFEKEDFSFNYLDDSLAGTVSIGNVLDLLNTLREAYFHADNKKDKNVAWFQILELIPQSFNYTRTWSANYEIMLNIISQRVGHQLKEWEEFIKASFREIPNLLELAISAGIVFLDEREGKILYFDQTTGQIKTLCKIKEIS